MKNVVCKIIIALVLFLIPGYIYASDITPEAKRFRDKIQSFLKQEGFSPYVDEEESLCFKQDGDLFWIDVESDAPFRVSFFKQGFSVSDADEQALLEAINDVHYKYAAIRCAVSKGKNMVFFVQSFCSDPDCFTSVFYKNLKVLNTAYKTLQEFYSGNGGSTDASPSFVVLSADVAISDINGKIEVNFGEKIYASATKYFTPRLHILSSTSGSYDIYCKLFDANGELSTSSNSPSGYTWKSTVNVSEGYELYVLSGWGTNNAGNWPKGNYRMEFYCQGELLESKFFTVY